MVKIKNANNPNKLQSELKESNKNQGIDKSLHETKQEILRDYGGEFELIGNLLVGDQIRETHIKLNHI